MNEIARKANRVKFATIAKNLEKRNMEAICCETAEEACTKALELIADGSTVSWGGSVTLSEIGLLEKLKERELTLIDAFDAPGYRKGEYIYNHMRTTLMADTFLMSTNAITLDGKLVNIDGAGNRMAALIFGPKQVIIIAGANKIAEQEEDALARVRAHACPANATRLGKEKTPCALTGKCGDCLVQENMCSHTVVTRFSKPRGRIKVILVNEELGF